MFVQRLNITLFHWGDFFFLILSFGFLLPQWTHMLVLSLFMGFICSSWTEHLHTSFWLDFHAEASASLNLILHVLTWNNRLPDISTAKIGLFRIKRELQFGVSNNAKPLQTPCMAGEEEYLYRREKEGGRVKITESPWFFISWVLARKEEVTFLFLMSSIIAGHESFPSWSTDSV